MIKFENGIDLRCRQVTNPQIAMLHLGFPYGIWVYCVIGTQYGYWHTSSGDVQTWKTASGARKALKRYVPI